MDFELFKPLKLALRALKLTGMWQDGNQSWSYFILGYILRFIFFELNFITIAMEIAVQQCQEEVVKLLFYIALLTVLEFKGWSFIFNIKNIQRSFRDLMNLLVFSADDRRKSREQIKTKVTAGYKIYKAFLAAAWLNCFIGFIKAVFTHATPLKAWFPFDVEASEVGFWIASVYLTLISIAVSACLITLGMLPAIFMTFAIGLIDELSDRLARVGETQNIEKELIKCVKIHQKIKKFVVDIERNFSTGIFVQGFVSSFLLCSNVFKLSKVR
jgi:hypothetical protein